ncbi:MAG: sterol desaturase/sphingolipid hydroxylase (fatty acid hydroxylase superfamily) [Candidatus Aldehydirespiratoraceae bacterium]|jgi:sterol desaturase/sphingolipid hydroxylase (fatty acid hydroxylase superfamily)
MIQFFDDVPATLGSLAALFENVLLPLLLLELIWFWRTKKLGKPKVKEMLANASSLLFIIPAGAVGVFAWFSLFEAIQGLMPWQIPVTWVSAIIGIVLVDLIYYLEHRFEHTHRLPWDLYHSVHHSSPDFNQTTSLRLSGFDALLTIGYLTPLIVVGFEPELVLLAYGLVVGYQTWIHTELIDKMPRWFEFVFNTPSHHRAHHGSEDYYLDANYGGILIVWDRLFSTFKPETHRPLYGLTTQIESSNPLDVQFSEIRKLGQDLRGDRRWATRLQRLWQAPGWQPTTPVSKELETTEVGS